MELDRHAAGLVAKDPLSRKFLTEGLPRLRERFDALECRLFGSRVRGDWMEYSDLDVILVSPSFGESSWLERGATVLDLLGPLSGVQPLCYTPEEFARKRLEIGIVSEGLREGIKVA